MNKTRLIFVRHGESEANLAGVFVGGGFFRPQHSRARY